MVAMITVSFFGKDLTSHVLSSSLSQTVQLINMYNMKLLKSFFIPSQHLHLGLRPFEIASFNW